MHEPIVSHAKRNLVFLDIDGVLVNRRSLAERSGQKAVADHKCVYALNHVTNITGAKIVLSSSWRFCGLEEMRLILRHWGVIAELVSMTPDLTRKPADSDLYVATPRREEIKAWLEQNGMPDRLVVIDDDADADLGDGRFVRTQFEQGLTEHDAHRAIAMLAEASR